MAPIACGILTVSDTCSTKPEQDRSGPKLEELLKTHCPSYRIQHRSIVPDDQAVISKTLLDLVSQKCTLILTTGGTGPALRDVTPEATRMVIDRELPGMQLTMLVKSLQVTPMAMLSRAVCGIRDESLIINLPGSVKGAAECLTFLLPALPHALDLILDKQRAVAEAHKEIQQCCSKVCTDNVAERPRQSQFAMVEVAEAIDLIIKESLHAKTERIQIDCALNRVLAESVIATEDIPSFDASIKDGYAVIAADGVGTRKVRRVGAAAGDKLSNEELVQNGQVVRISTGAPIPQGADAVVQVEDTVVHLAEDGVELEILINKKPNVGQDIRKKGSDVAEGDEVLQKGQRLKSAHVGVLATIGQSFVNVYRAPTVGIITTGNELKDHHEKLQPGQIRDSNRLTLINLLQEYNYKCNDHGIVRDNPNDVKKAFETAFKFNDILITTGGVSMGEFDFVKRVLVDDFGATIHFGRINMKPGKPTTFATLIFDGVKKMVFSLPGNPVSASVTCLLFVIPTLKRIEGNNSWQFPKIPYVVSTTKKNADIRPDYVRVSVSYKEGEIVAVPNGRQVSSRLNSLVGANGLLLMPPDMIPNKDYSTHIILIDQIIT